MLTLVRRLWAFRTSLILLLLGAVLAHQASSHAAIVPSLDGRRGEAEHYNGQYFTCLTKVSSALQELQKTTDRATATQELQGAYTASLGAGSVELRILRQSFRALWSLVPGGAVPVDEPLPLFGYLV